MNKKLFLVLPLIAISVLLSSYSSAYSSEKVLGSKRIVAKTTTTTTVQKTTLAYTYHVYGKKYGVMSSSHNYDEKGIASWYGPRFQHKHTSSGERFNMYSLTAAHKTLPLSTYVLVTNLHNGKKVVVKVNDRGPFVGNRIIDLSYAAAKKLGMVGLGTANVDVKAITPI